MSIARMSRASAGGLWGRRRAVAPLLVLCALGASATGVKAETLPPSVSTQRASGVTQDAATLNGFVDPRGSEITECEFEYGTTTFTKSVPCSTVPPAVERDVAVSQQVLGLSVDTRYIFRVDASTAGGRAVGATWHLETQVELSYGICVAQKKGEAGYYAESDCVERAEKVKRRKYEWEPGPAPTCAHVKRGFYSTKTCTTRDEKKGAPKGTYEKEPGAGYSSTLGTLRVETPGLSSLVLLCTAGHATGEVTGVRTGVERFTFTGCEAAGKACQSEGPDSTPSGAAGTIVTNLLDTTISEAIPNEVWITLVSAQHEPYVFEANCEGTLLRVSGSLAGVQTGNIGVESFTSTTTFSLGGGEQKLYTELSESAGESWVGPAATSEAGVATNTAASETEIKL